MFFWFETKNEKKNKRESNLMRKTKIDVIEIILLFVVNKKNQKTRKIRRRSQKIKT